jgi:hypothetical protein
MTNEKLKTILREIIGEVLEEMTGTGAVAGYNTPNAFQGPGDSSRKKKIAARSMPGGKVVGEEENPDEVTEGDRLPMIRRGAVAEGRGRYHNYKTDESMKTHGKISYGIREAHKMLREVEFLVGICERLKTESGTASSDLWKRTGGDVVKMHQRLKEIAKRINRLNK